IYRRDDDRSFSSCVRRGDRQRNLEGSTSDEWRGYSDDVPDAEKRQAVSRDCGGRAPRCYGRAAKRFDCGVHTALNACGALRHFGEWNPMPLLVTEADVESILTMPLALELVETSFRRLA